MTGFVIQNLKVIGHTAGVRPVRSRSLEPDLGIIELGDKVSRQFHQDFQEGAHLEPRAQAAFAWLREASTFLDDHCALSPLSNFG
ncbi:MAG: hypothetical protein ACXV3E_07460, partial [Halobacteriota archaeon]